MILPDHPAFYRGLYRNKHANTSGQSSAFTKFPSQAAAPRPLFSPPPPPPATCRLSLRFPPIPAGGSRESNYFSQRSAIHSSGRQERSGGSSSRRAAPPPPPGPPGPGSSGRGEASRGGARSPAVGTICPSARRAAAPAPTSTGLSGRRLAKGFPRRAPPANRRRAGGARGPRTRTFQDRRLTRTASTPRTLPVLPRPVGLTRAPLRGLLQVQAWTASPGPQMLLSKVKVK